MELHQRLLLILACCCGQLAAAASAPALPQLARLNGDGARITALVVDLESGQSLAELAPTQRLTPASLSKIVIAAAALETWAPDYSFPTELRSATAPVNGVIYGNLVLRGSGDATLDETTLWALAAQVRSTGIRRITGTVTVERAPFGELQCDTIDRCASLRRSARAYNAAPSAVGVNYGSWCIAVRAPEGARVANVGGCATGELPIPLSGSVQVASGGAGLSVERSTDDTGDRIVVSGSIAPGTERQIHRAMSDPAAGAGLILRSMLRQIGVTVDGAVETTALPVAAATRLVAKVDGISLQEQIVRMMRYSSNYIADVLTMGVALARNGTSPASLAEASQELTAMVRGSGEADSSAPGPLLESGSGLTTSNRLSARDLVNVLTREYRDSRRFPPYYGSFVAPHDAAFANLRNGNADWLDRVALKTGSLSEPYSVNGIAGYLRKKNGGWMAFAIIVNGSDKQRQISPERALGAARSDLEALLSRY